MIKKQDIAAPRTVQDMERRYKFGKTFAETMGLAKEASKTAEKAEETVESVSRKLTHEEIFNLLTKDGTLEGLYRGEDGELYVNAKYMVTGVLASKDGESVFIDLDNGRATLTGSLTTEDTEDNTGYVSRAKISPGAVEVLGYRKSDSTNNIELTRITPGSVQLQLATGEDVGKYHAFMSISPVSGYSMIRLKGNDSSNSYLTIRAEGTKHSISGLSSPTNDYDAACKVYVDRRTLDYIVEQGTSGIWTYRKWNSGKIELWTNSYQFTVTFTKSSIGIYYATENNIPVPLVKNIEFASGDCTKWHYVNWASVTCNDGKNLGIRYYGLNANGGGSTIPFSFYVIGTWK